MFRDEFWSQHHQLAVVGERDTSQSLHLENKDRLLDLQSVSQSGYV